MANLTIEERCLIERMLREQNSICSIAERLGKHQSTIVREIKKPAIECNKFAANRFRNRCVSRYDCELELVCSERGRVKFRPGKKCRCRNQRSTRCKMFAEESCRPLKCTPYVCNGCEAEKRCVLRKKFYLHDPAHKTYRHLLAASGCGANLTEEERLASDELATPLIRKGQSIRRIPAANPDHFPICEKALYRYVDNRLIVARNFELPR